MGYMCCLSVVVINDCLCTHASKTNHFVIVFGFGYIVTAETRHRNVELRRQIRLQVLSGFGYGQNL